MLLAFHHSYGAAWFVRTMLDAVIWSGVREVMHALFRGMSFGEIALIVGALLVVCFLATRSFVR